MIKQLSAFIQCIKGKDVHDFIPWLQTNLNIAKAAQDFAEAASRFEELGNINAARLDRDTDQQALKTMLVSLRVMQGSRAAAEATGAHEDLDFNDGLKAISLVSRLDALVTRSCLHEAIATKCRGYSDDINQVMRMLDGLVKGMHKPEKSWKRDVGADAGFDVLRQHMTGVSSLPAGKIEEGILKLQQVPCIYSYRVLSFI